MSDIRDQENYFVVILGDAGSKVLLAKEPSEARDAHFLPQIQIPKWQRTGLHITLKIRDLFSLETIVLFRPSQHDGNNAGGVGHSNGTRCCVLEARTRGWNPPEGVEWVEPSSVEPTVFVDSQQHRLLMGCLEEARAYKTGNKSGPFAIVGWFDELIRWARPFIEAQGLHLTGAFQQHNGNPNFSLIRLETDGKPIWFKAANDEKWPEYGLTMALSERYPRYFPKVFACRPGWRGWLMEHIDNRLDQVMQFEKWKQAVVTLAEFQLELAGKDDYLLGIGCRDWRMPSIVSLITPLLDKMDVLMQQQETTPPPTLSKNELLALGDAVRSACDRLASLSIPESFTHGDFSAGNILANPYRCVLIDLAESYLGHPFLTFQYLLDGLHTYHPECDGWHDDLRRAYADTWRGLCSQENIDEAFRLMPLVTILWHTVGGNGWQDPEGLLYARRAKYYRSLTRKMYQRAQQLEHSGSAIATA